MAQYTSSRELVVAICRTLLERGYLKVTEGNVSVRVPGRDLFAITPTSTTTPRCRPTTSACSITTCIASPVP